MPLCQELFNAAKPASGDSMVAVCLHFAKIAFISHTNKLNGSIFHGAHIILRCCTPTLHSSPHPERRRHAKNDAPLPQAACWAACAAYEEGAADNALEYACQAVNGSIRHEVTRLYLYVAYRPGSDTSGYGKAPLRIAKPRRKHLCRKTASQTAPAPGPGNNASTRPSTQARIQLSTESDAPRLAEQTIEGLPATIPYPFALGNVPEEEPYANEPATTISAIAVK